MQPPLLSVLPAVTHVGFRSRKRNLSSPCKQGNAFLNQHAFYSPFCTALINFPRKPHDSQITSHVTCTNLRTHLSGAQAQQPINVVCSAGGAAVFTAAAVPPSPGRKPAQHCCRQRLCAVRQQPRPPAQRARQVGRGRVAPRGCRVRLNTYLYILTDPAADALWRYEDRWYASTRCVLQNAGKEATQWPLAHIRPEPTCSNQD